MKMSNDNVAVSLLEIDRRTGVHDPAEATDRELEHERNCKQKRGRKLEPATPDRGNPRENLDAGGNRDQHRGYRERAVRNRTHSGGEHMMAPNPVRQKRDEDQ